MEGTVKWFDGTKGYGFIAGEEGKEYFVHHTEVKPEGTVLDEGDKVNFETKQTEKGMQASNVTKQEA